MSPKRIFIMAGIVFSGFPAFSHSTPSEVNNFIKTESSSGRSSHFTWGAEIGTSIDITGYDSSTFNFDGQIGYKNSYIKFLGLGVGIHRAMGSGDNYVPVYATIRTSFTKRPKLFFMTAKAGYSFNTIGEADTFGDINASIGGGINLSISTKFQSYITLSYEFRHFNTKHRDAISMDTQNVSMASLTFGINF